jgi:hypothetical protein
MTTAMRLENGRTGLSAVERACERATLAQLDVVGQGHMRDGRRFFLVPSSADETQPARVHVVTLQRSRHPHCDCDRPVCDHVGAVLMALVAEASERQRFAELVEAALTSEIPSPECLELDTGKQYGTGRTTGATRTAGN